MQEVQSPRPGRRPWRVVYPTALLGLCLSWTSCAGAARRVELESNYWRSFQLAAAQPLAAGESELPLAVSPGYCYRILLAAGQSPPQLSFRDEIDADLVGFPLHQLAPRSPQGGGAALAVYGLCSQGQGTITLVISSQEKGRAAWYEAAFHRLPPAAGRDVVEAGQWLHQRQSQAEQDRRQAAEAARQAAVAQLVRQQGPALQSQLAQAVRRRGRFPSLILDEVHGVDEWRETFALDPGRCYLFALLPHGSTTIEGTVYFSRIRNATERTDLGGAVTHSVCTAPSGPIQEATFLVQATAPEAKHPPLFALRVAHRRATAAERRAADREWRRNQPDRRW